jgi:hypothetical protein
MGSWISNTIERLRNPEQSKGRSLAKAPVEPECGMQVNAPISLI